jgi:hypothetical protein
MNLNVPSHFAPQANVVSIIAIVIIFFIYLL